MLITFALWSRPFVALAHQTLPQWYMDLQSLVQGPCQAAPVISPFWNPVFQCWSITKLSKYPQSFSEVAAEHRHRHQTHAHSLPCFPGFPASVNASLSLQTDLSSLILLGYKVQSRCHRCHYHSGVLVHSNGQDFLLLTLHHDLPIVTIKWCVCVCVVSLAYWSRTPNCLPGLLECLDYRHESPNPAST